MDDLISRQAAIYAIRASTSKYTGFMEMEMYTDDDAVEAIEGLPSAQPEQRWIPVSERLPEYGIQVLTTDKDGDFELNHIIDEDDEEWFFDGAIAWCELPEPWKGDSDG